MDGLASLCEDYVNGQASTQEIPKTIAESELIFSLVQRIRYCTVGIKKESSHLVAVVEALG